ncbi:hypothetical protein [Metaplanococcus flavidus]|uniref:Uncharacterized protein n=1 Tax=Metaplanococcus flavidus TaxID=569883 RepID=A0ABW3LCI7_9BACL
MTKKDNAIAMSLQILGGVMIAAFALRALMAIDEFGGGPAFEILLQGVIFGMLLIGFGEVIKLMQGLFNQREPERPVEDPEMARRQALRISSDSSVSIENRNKIMDYYTKKNMVVDDIEATPYDGYAIVHHDGRKDVVDLNNWELEVLSEAQLRKNPELRNLVE